MRCPPTIVFAMLVVVIAGCTSPPNEANDASAGSSNPSVSAAPRNLGWLGGKVRLAVESIAVPDPDDAEAEVFPGALVLVELEAGHPLAEAGLQNGDLLIGVGESLLPYKEDPTLDFIRLVEGEVSAEAAEIALAYLRQGRQATARFSTNLRPLEEGLPFNVERLRRQLAAAQEYLSQQQLDDGSFPTADDSAAAALAVTAMCGLGMRSTDDGRHQDQLQRCLDYVLAQASRDAHPLAAAYALVCLSEMSPPSASGKQVAAYLEAIHTGQAENGGWLVGNEEPPAAEDGETRAPTPGEISSDEPTCDVEGTFATNQILLALGIAERNGVIGDNEVIRKAIGYLKRQSEVRISADLDRRVKAGLSAGTATALVALNVDRADSFVMQLAKEARALAADVPLSRTLAVPHTLATSLLSRQQGVPAYLEHYEHSKFLISSLQQSDGSFATYPGANIRAVDFERQCAGACWTTAHACLQLQLQSDLTAAFTGERTPPLLAVRAGDGSQKEAGGGTPDARAAVRGLTVDFDPTGLSPEELKEKLMEQLKEQGIDADGGNVQIISTGEPPQE